MPQILCGHVKFDAGRDTVIDRRILLTKTYGTYQNNKRNKPAILVRPSRVKAV